MPQGQILKAISGFFYVGSSTGIVPCRSRGIFKYEKKKLTPLVGDLVEFEWSGEKSGVITQIRPRRTELIRPTIANVDQAVIISSLRFPQIQFQQIDRFLVYGEYKNLDLILCITKQDLLEDQREVHHIQDIYETIGYPVLVTSIYSQVGLTELKQYLSLKTSVFAGESGVGKSSLLQQLIPDQVIPTGVISQRLGRGKHTTKAVELLPLPNGGQVADTPGFSKLYLNEIPLPHLDDCFPEFRKPAKQCYYRNCSHINEPKCEVVDAVQRGAIHAQRYRSYRAFYTEIQEAKGGNSR